MKKSIIALTCLLATALTISAQDRDWENNHVLQINREPARACFIPYAQQKGDRQMSLNGIWKFRWTKTPDERIKDFWRTGYDCSSWDNLTVPANWEVNGYGTPIYASAGYTFKIDPPYVTKEPKKTYTAYEERNPTGQYKRTFTLPDDWKKGQTFLRFEGVMSAFYVWLNGRQVGYSQGSMESSEFLAASIAMSRSITPPISVCATLPSAPSLQAALITPSIPTIFSSLIPSSPSMAMKPARAVPLLPS